MSLCMSLRSMGLIAVRCTKNLLNNFIPSIRRANLMRDRAPSFAQQSGSLVHLPPSSTMKAFSCLPEENLNCCRGEELINSLVGRTDQ